MKKFTTKDFFLWQPCHSPLKHVDESWEGTPLEIIAHQSPTVTDKFFLLLRPEMISNSQARQFVLYGAELIFQNLKNYAENKEELSGLLNVARSVDESKRAEIRAKTHLLQKEARKKWGEKSPIVSLITAVHACFRNGAHGAANQIVSILQTLENKEEFLSHALTVLKDIISKQPEETQQLQPSR